MRKRRINTLTLHGISDANEQYTGIDDSGVMWRLIRYAVTDEKTCSFCGEFVEDAFLHDELAIVVCAQHVKECCTQSAPCSTWHAVTGQAATTLTIDVHLQRITLLVTFGKDAMIKVVWSKPDHKVTVATLHDADVHGIAHQLNDAAARFTQRKQTYTERAYVWRSIARASNGLDDFMQTIVRYSVFSSWFVDF